MKAHWFQPPRRAEQRFDPVHAGEDRGVPDVGRRTRVETELTALAWHGLLTDPVPGRQTLVLHRHAAEHEPVDVGDPAIAAALQSSGEALPETLRHEMEAHLEVPLAAVRVHTDAVAAQAARALAADAFTLGVDIFFAAGRFAPSAPSGRQLLAHELAHVAQALRGQHTSGHAMLQVSQPGDPLERDADAVAARIATAPPPEARPVAAAAMPASSKLLHRSANAQREAKPVAAMSLEERVREVTRLLGAGSGAELLRVFETCTPRDFVLLQEQVALAAVLARLDDWQIVKLGARGPIIAAHRRTVNEARARLIVDITRKWGPSRAQVFTRYIFDPIADDDAISVLQALAADQHLHDTIDVMPDVTKHLDERGVDRSRIRDRDWQAKDIVRGVQAGLAAILSTSPAAQAAEGLRAAAMAQDLPAGYRAEVEADDRAARADALAPGSFAFATLDHITLGLLAMAKGVVWDVPLAIRAGGAQLADGHVAAGAEQLTGPAIFVVGTALGARAFVRSTRIASVLELTADGQALYRPLKAIIGDKGLQQVARWAQQSSAAQIFIRKEGQAGIEALYRANGDVAAARAALRASRAAPAANPTPPKPFNTAAVERLIYDSEQNPGPGTNIGHAEQHLPYPKGSDAQTRAIAETPPPPRPQSTQPRPAKQNSTVFRSRRQGVQILEGILNDHHAEIEALPAGGPSLGGVVPLSETVPGFNSANGAPAQSVVIRKVSWRIVRLATGELHLIHYMPLAK